MATVRRINIDAIKAQLKDSILFRGIIRHHNADRDFPMEDRLAVIRAIGVDRNPSFVFDKYNLFTYTQMLKWIHADEDFQSLDPNKSRASIVKGDLTKGIYIAGTQGTGKSWAMEIFLQYLQYFPMQIQCGTTKMNLWWRIARASEIVAKFVKTQSIEEYKSVKILCIQDLGSEALEAVSMGTRMNVLRDLIEYRGDRSDCLTMFTSNYRMGSDSIDKAYGTRVVSRLYGMCNYLEIGGPDRRRN